MNNKLFCTFTSLENLEETTEEVKSSYDILYKKTDVCFQSAPQTKINFKKKEKIISFIGKLNSAKGYDLFGEAIIRILDKYPAWKSNVYGDEPREKLTYKHKNLNIIRMCTYC